MDLRGKRVVVLGLGVSGIAAVKLCVARGAQVIGSDGRSVSELSEAARQLAVPFEPQSSVDWSTADCVIVSPGVPSFAALDEAEQRGVEVIGELELAARFCSAPLIAVGGTNGKSTTTLLAAQILRAAGKTVFAGGNLGEPLSQAAPPLCATAWDALVVEVSSFQLERVTQFRPKVGLLLNVTEDHLDRYPSFEAYQAAKGNAFVRQGEHDFAVILAEDASCATQAARGRGKVLRFGPSGDYVVTPEGVMESSTGQLFDTRGTRLHARVNRLNAAAAIAATRALGVGADAIASAIGRFEPLGHRMALVEVLEGVRYYDDSKGTNVGAAVAAVGALEEPRVVLIAGGRDKHGSYQALAQALGVRGRALVVLGEAGPRIAAACASLLPIFTAKDMQDAVRIAAREALPGDAVLLSPACSSFDMFNSYAERGDVFARAVRELAASARLTNQSVEPRIGSPRCEGGQG